MTKKMFDQLPHITSRIEANYVDGSAGVGTGFHLLIEARGKQRPLLVTNRHVAENAKTMTIYMSIEGKDGSRKEDEIYEAPLELDEQSCIFHPDYDVAVLPLDPVFRAMKDEGLKPYLKALSFDLIPTEDDIKDFSAIENVFMVGYPSGIWDETNNLPVTRRGITATPYSVNYRGKPEFLIDAACFPGSSGSPIMIAEEITVVNAKGKIESFDRGYFLGFLWGGPQHIGQGKIVPKPVPTVADGSVHIPLPLNLGFCVKSNVLLEMKAEILSRWGIVEQ